MEENWVRVIDTHGRRFTITIHRPPCNGIVFWNAGTIEINFELFTEARSRPVQFPVAGSFDNPRQDWVQTCVRFVRTGQRNAWPFLGRRIAGAGSIVTQDGNFIILLGSRPVAETGCDLGADPVVSITGQWTRHVEWIGLDYYSIALADTNQDRSVAVGLNGDEISTSHLEKMVVDAEDESGIERCVYHAEKIFLASLSRAGTFKGDVQCRSDSGRILNRATAKLGNVPAAVEQDVFATIFAT